MTELSGEVVGHLVEVLNTDWQEIMAVEDWRHRNRLVEDALRRFLAVLPEEDAPIPTRDMLDRLLPADEIDATTRERVIKQIMNIASHVPSLRSVTREVATSGWSAGKEVNRYRWSYRPYKSVPGTPVRPIVVVGDRLPPPTSIEPAGSQALGAANSGASLTELRLDLELVTRRVEKLEAALKTTPLMEG